MRAKGPCSPPRAVSLPFDLGPWQALWLAIAIFGAAFVRGYSGFGFAALIVSAAGLVTDPLHLVPVVLLADILLTAQQARGIWRDVDWRRVLWLGLGCVAGVPFGVWAIAQVGGDTARLVISLYVLAMCVVLIAGWHIRRAPGAAAPNADRPIIATLHPSRARRGSA